MINLLDTQRWICLFLTRHNYIRFLFAISQLRIRPSRWLRHSPPPVSGQVPFLYFRPVVLTYPNSKIHHDRRTFMLSEHPRHVHTTTSGAVCQSHASASARRSNSFPCHTSAKFTGNSFRCHTYKFALLQVLSLPHIQ